MGQKPITPQFVRFTDKVASLMPWMGLCIGLGLVAVSVWGLRACQSIARAYALPGARPNPVVVSLSWLVLFLPIALVGACLAAWVLRRMREEAGEKRIRVKLQEPVTILPPPSIYAGSFDGDSSRRPIAAYAPQPVHREPLDDATTYRLGEIADRAASIFNVGIGLFFLLSGLLGFLVIWIDARQRVSNARQFSYQTHLLVGCGFLIFIGASILLRITRKPDTAWLAPLRVFTKIVSMRAAAEGSRSAAVNSLSSRPTTRERSD